MKTVAICTLTLLALSACALGVDATANDGMNGGASPTVSVGKASYDNHQCGTCHGADLSGSDHAVSGTTSVYASNITPDPMGVGGWTNDQMYGAIRLGRGLNGRSLCSSMPHYKISDTELTALVDYLRSVPPVSHQVAISDCSGTAPTLSPDAGTPAPTSADDGGAVQDASSNPCADFAAPNTKAACHACKTNTCQANGCYGGYYCDTKQTKCVAPPNGC